MTEIDATQTPGHCSQVVKRASLTERFRTSAR